MFLGRRSGNSRRGRPDGMWPTTVTPLSAKPTMADTAMAMTTTMSAPGIFRDNRRAASRAARDTNPTASGPADVRDLANDFDELTRRSLGVDAQAQHLSELTDDQYHRDTVEVADEHGSREVVRDPAQPCQPRPQERGPNE